MMEALKQYVLTVTTSAVICAIVISIAKTGKHVQLMKAVCGLFLAFSVLSPLGELELAELLPVMSIQNQAQGNSDAGELYARETLSSIITDRFEAYILDKAAGMGTEVAVHFLVTDESLPVPCAVNIQGRVSPYIKQQLANILEKDLGITKENQTWED